MLCSSNSAFDTPLRCAVNIRTDDVYNTISPGAEQTPSQRRTGEGKRREGPQAHYPFPMDVRQQNRADQSPPRVAAERADGPPSPRGTHRSGAASSSRESTTAGTDMRVWRRRAALAHKCDE